MKLFFNASVQGTAGCQCKALVCDFVNDLTRSTHLPIFE